MNAQILKDLCSFQCLEWKGQLLFEGVDLCGFISPSTIDEAEKYVSMNYPKNCRYRFPDKYDGIKNGKKLINDLILSSNRSGYCLVTRSSRQGEEKKQESVFIKRCKSYTLICDRAFPYRKGKKESSTSLTDKENLKSRRTFTNRPVTTDDCCTFKIVIFLGTDIRWYLSTISGALNSEDFLSIHRGHPRLPPDNIYSSIRRMDAATRALISKSNTAAISSTAVSVLVQLESAQNWSPRQIQYLNRHEQDLVQDLSPKLSSADQLVYNFNNKQNVTWLMITHEPGSGFFVVSKVGKRSISSDKSLSDEKADEIRTELTLSKEQKLILIFACKKTGIEKEISHQNNNYLQLD